MTLDHTMEIKSEHHMEKILDTIEQNLSERIASVYHLYLPSVKWVAIILENVNTIGNELLEAEDSDSENPLVNIEFIIDDDNDDSNFKEEDYFPS